MSEQRFTAAPPPAGDVIHCQEGDNRTDIPQRYVVTMMMAAGQPMLVFVDDDELKTRKCT